MAPDDVERRLRAIEDDLLRYGFRLMALEEWRKEQAATHKQVPAMTISLIVATTGVLAFLAQVLPPLITRLWGP
jgi:hypothetical protein